MPEETPANSAGPELPTPGIVSLSPDAAAPASARRGMTIADIEPDADGRIDWWKPGWSDIWKALSWKYAWAAVLLAILIGGFFAAAFYGFLFYAVVDVGAVLLAVLAAGTAVAIRKILSSRSGPFCIHCGYSLDAGPPHLASQEMRARRK